MSKHTPGPWKVCVEDDLTFVCHEEHLGREDHCGLLMLVHDGTPADAHLASTAPDLLEALTEIAKGEGRYSRDNYTMCCNTVEDMKALALKAIAKLEGR